MDALRGIKHRVGDGYRSVVSAVVAPSKESRFVESGTLTPEEFMQAGEQLVYKFPTWRWANSNEMESAKLSSHLPKDQQYLITKGVPCRDRVRALDYVLTHNTRLEDDWTLPETATGTNGASEELRDVDDLTQDLDKKGEMDSAVSSGCIIATDEDYLSGGGGGGLPDYSDLDAELADPEDSASASRTATSFGGCLVAEAPDAFTVNHRTYDLSITYDTYYQTPRLWLFGYDENKRPLKPDEVYEDVLSEYVSKTVTIDPHPLTGTPTVSIHPCKHAQVMKKVVAEWIQQDIKPRHDLALFVFLKFISSVVPTINYDFTMDIEF